MCLFALALRSERVSECAGACVRVRVRACVSCLMLKNNSILHCYFNSNNVSFIFCSYPQGHHHKSGSHGRLLLFVVSKGDFIF